MRRFLILPLLLAWIVLGLLSSGALAQAPDQTPFLCSSDDLPPGVYELCTTPWPTWTLTPTSTPFPSSTPSPTSSVTPEPTPTQELTLPPTQPTATFTPSPTPPLLSTCWGTVNATLPLRVRDVPWGEIVGAVNNGEMLVFDAMWVDQILWWRLDQPLDNGEIGWVSAEWITVGNTANCDTLDDLTPSAHTIGVFFHAVPGLNIDNARRAYGVLRDKAVDYGIKIYGDMTVCLDALFRGGTCIYRHPNVDYPQLIGSSDPRRSARQYFADYGEPVCNILRDYDKAYWEVVNEPNLGGSQSDTSLNIIYWWNDWTDEIITSAQDYGCPKLVILTGGPGHGEPTQYRIWKDMLNRAASLGYLLGEHAYTPYHDDGLCACDEWLACRHRTNEAYRQAEGVDIDVAITEAARGWGNDPVDEADFACWIEEICHDEYVHSVALWTAGFHSTWPLANLDNHMLPIAGQVQCGK